MFSKNRGETWHLYEMIREPKGIYRLKLDGNFDCAYYNYIVENSGISKCTIDPYAKGSTANGTSSVVINFKKVKIDLEEKLPWGHIDVLVTQNFFKKEFKNAMEEKVTPNCRQKCAACGAACANTGVCFEER